MALRRGAAHYRFAGGIDTKSAPEGVHPARLLQLENAVFTRAGSIRKRNGYTGLSLNVDGSTTALSGLIRLGKRDGELLGFTSSRCYSHEPEADHWSDVGPVYSVVGADRPIVRTGTEQTMPDHATLDGISVYAWEDNGVWYSVIDERGHIHLAPTLADAGGISPRCVPCGAALHVLFANATLGRVYVVVVNPASPSAAVAPQILVDDLSTTNPVYDVIPTTTDGYDDTPAFIAWHERATNNYRLGFVHTSGVLGGPLTGLSSVVTRVGGMSAASPIAIASIEPDLVSVVAQPNGSGNVTAVHHDAGGAFAVASEVTVAAVTSPQRIAAAWALATTLLWVAIEEAAVEPSNRYCTINSVSLSTPGTPRVQRSVGLASRAWSIGESEDVFVYALHDVVYFNTYTALRLSDSLCIARTLPGLAADGPARKHLASAHVDGDTARVALPYNERLPSENADQFTETGIRLATLDFDSEDSHQTAQLGRGLYLGGACPQHYDGRQWTEHGFHVGPELIATVNGGSGSLNDDNTYLYRCWYEWTDAQGEIHRGPVSFGTLVTLAAGEDEVTLTLPTLRITQKWNVRIMVARSRAAETGKTDELFLVSSRDPTAGGPNGYVANDTAVDTVTFVDRMSDDTLETMEPAYTNGGILSTDPSALGHLIAEGKGRLFYNDPADPNAVRYSQQLEAGYAVEVPPELVLTVPPYGGAITALAVDDENGRVLVFKRDAIFAFAGPGPLANGDPSTSAFSEPQRLRSPVGCADPASIVVTPAATLFKSAQGIWQIDGAGQVSYVGAPVEGYNAQRITAATALPDRTQVVFLTDSGRTLLYDYLFGQWGTWTNHEGLAAVVVENTYHYLREVDGRVFRETIGSYSDDGQRITLRLETAWLHMTEALQGFQRFWNLLLLGTWLSPHQLMIQSRVNYAPGQLPTSQASGWSPPVYLDATGESSSTGWITGDGANTIGEDPIVGSNYGDGAYGDGVYGGTDPDIYQWRYHIGGRGQSVQLRFEDFERSGLAGASFELTEMQIEGGTAGPSYKPIPSARSA